MKVYKQGDKQLGVLRDGVFRKAVDISKHFMRKTRSWGIDLSVFEKLPEDTRIEIYEKTLDRLYVTDYHTYASEGIIDDYGYGRQVFLNEDKFKKYEKISSPQKG